MSATGLFAELSRRRVFRVTATYSVVAWLAVQAGDSLAPALQLPDWSVGLVVYMLVLGFPIAMVLAWAYDIGPAGIVSDQSAQRLPPRQIIGLASLALTATLGLFLLLSLTIGGMPVNADSVAWRAGELRDRSIAVAPFVDNSPGQDQEWLATGLGQEILQGLPRIEHLLVAEVPAGMDAREVGRQHAVASVLSGNLQRVGARVRLNVRLIDTSSGYQIWTASYDGQLDDIFEFQASTAANVVRDLETLFSQVPVR